MFHVKRRKTPLLLTLVAFAAMAVACTSATQPRGWAAPVKTDPVLLVSTGHGHFDALDPSSMQRLWRFPGEVHCDGCGNIDWVINGSGAGTLKGVYGDPVQAKNGTVYFGDYNGYLYAIRPADVKKGLTDSSRPHAATFKFSAPIIGGVALDEASGQLYVASGDSVYKLATSQLDARFDNKDAKIEFAKLLSTGKDIWATPVIDGGKVYIASLDGTLYALDGDTGKEAWHFTSSSGLASTPLISNGLLIIGGFDNKVHAIDAGTGAEKWSTDTDSWVWSKPTVSSGTAYFGDFDGSIFAVNVADGSKMWTKQLDHGSIRGAPAVTSDAIVVATESGWLVGLAKDGQTKLWERKLDTSINPDAVGTSGNVLIAPSGCVAQDDSSNKTKVYYVSVEASSGQLNTADGVC
jgi:outer membrane protein assembly factor BamB